jgi:hypothetical protein
MLSVASPSHLFTKTKKKIHIVISLRVFWHLQKKTCEFLVLPLLVLTFTPLFTFSLPLVSVHASYGKRRVKLKIALGLERSNVKSCCRNASSRKTSVPLCAARLRESSVRLAFPA